MRRPSPRPLTCEQIKGWIADHITRTGSPPTPQSGPVLAAPSETWADIYLALAQRFRGLVEGYSLNQLIGQVLAGRGRPLTTRQVLRWADAHRRRTGCWPTLHDGGVEGQPGEVWADINRALRYGWRGLPPSGGLRLLLKRERVIPLRPTGCPRRTARSGSAS
jgi:hypothetical protein